MHRLADELLAYGKVTHGWLGIEGADLSDAKADVIGRPRRRRGPAGRWRGAPPTRSGLAGGDVITEVGGERIRSSSDLVVALRAHKPGEVVVVGYWRSGRHHEAEVTIEPRPVAVSVGQRRRRRRASAAAASATPPTSGGAGRARAPAPGGGAG